MEILWLVIFILYSIYKSYKETQKKQEQAKRRMQRSSTQTVSDDHGTSGMPRGEQKLEPYEKIPWDFEPMVTETTETIKSVEVFEKIEPKEEKVNKYLDALDKAKIRKRKKSAPLMVEEIDETPTTSFKKLALNFDSNSIRHAVIMSEILQPPRAKRPYRYRY